MAGVCNVVFTVALLLLTAKFLPTVNVSIAGLMLLGCVWFPVIHPGLIYMQAKKQAAALKEDMTLSFDDSGICAKTSEEVSHVSWKQVRNILKRPYIIIICSGSRHGFLLPDRMLGDQKEDFLEYINKMVK